MKKIYALFLVLLVVGSAACLSCGSEADTMPLSEELFSDDAIVSDFENDEYDPTNPPDSTYDPFPDGE